MKNTFFEIISSNNYFLIGFICAALLFLLFSKKIIWFIFRFDRDVAKLIKQKKSSEVRVGKIVESMAPFLENFPVDVDLPGSSTQFIGQPVDFVHFTPEGEVIFIEIKSGNAQLSATQRKIKKAVEDGQVSWVEYRVK